MIINAGIVEVVFENEYHFGDTTRSLFSDAGVQYRKFERK
jgi:deoxycytidylate deaminase